MHWEILTFLCLYSCVCMFTDESIYRNMCQHISKSLLDKKGNGPRWWERHGVESSTHKRLGKGSVGVCGEMRRGHWLHDMATLEASGQAMHIPSCRVPVPMPPSPNSLHPCFCHSHYIHTCFHSSILFS